MLADAILRQEASARELLHCDHASSRPLSPDYELVGLRGEAEFGRVFRQYVDFERRPAGDGQIDFIIPLRFTVDVKTARKPYNLLVEVGKVTADIYVLATYEEGQERARLLGWEHGSVVKAAPVRDFGHNISNHYIPANALRPIEDLRRRVMTLR